MIQLLGPDIIDQLSEAMKEGLTQSEIMLRTNCARKWFFKYIQRVKKQGDFSWALLMGDAVHKMLDEYYRDTGPVPSRCVPECPNFHFDEDVILTPCQKEEYEYRKMLASVMVERHNFYWQKFDERMVIINTEQEIEYQYHGFRLRGKVDMTLHPTPRSGEFIMDHKTAYMFSKSMFLGWNFRFQFLFYAWLYWKVTEKQPSGIYINALRKPGLRRSEKKAESIKDFIKRIDADMIQRPEDYFIREKLVFDKGTLQRFETYTLNPILLQFEMIGGSIESGWQAHLQDLDLMQLLESLLLAGNTDYCQAFNTPCEYLDLCIHNFNDYSQEYIRTEKKHPELLNDPPMN